MPFHYFWATLYRRSGPVLFGGWGLLPEYFLHCLPENQVHLPEYYENDHLKNSTAAP